MEYNILIEHLFNLKVYNSLILTNTKISQHIDTIRENAKLNTEFNLMQKDINLTREYRKSIIDLSVKSALGVYKDNEFLKIGKLLQESGLQEPIFGDLNLELENLYVFIKNEKELHQYVYGKTFIKPHRLLSEIEVTESYLKINETSLNCSFFEQIELLEYFKDVAETNLNVMISDFEKDLNKEDKEDYIRHVYEVYKKNIEKKEYILVVNTLKNSFESIPSISKLVFSFCKSNNISFELLREKKSDVVKYFTSCLFVEFIETNYKKAVVKLVINTELVFIQIQNRNQLHEVVKPDYLDSFKEIEKSLVDEGYFDAKGWVKEKIELIDFLIECDKKRYFKYSIDKKNKNILRDFFMKRYTVNIKKQYQPAEINKIKRKFKGISQFSWIKTP